MGFPLQPPQLRNQHLMIVPPSAPPTLPSRRDLMIALLLSMFPRLRAHPSLPQPPVFPFQPPQLRHQDVMTVPLPSPALPTRVELLLPHHKVYWHVGSHHPR